jgi:hypothetical protein
MRDSEPLLLVKSSTSEWTFWNLCSLQQRSKRCRQRTGGSHAAQHAINLVGNSGVTGFSASNRSHSCAGAMSPALVKSMSSRFIQLRTACQQGAHLPPPRISQPPTHILTWSGDVSLPPPMTAKLLTLT